MSQQNDVAHTLGGFAKWFAIVAFFGLSITLSYMFFASIAPPDKPWFPLAGLSLTEGGLVLWMLVFRLQKHHYFNKSVSLIMVCACIAACLSIASYEFYGLIASRYALIQNTWIFQIMAIALVGIFMLHGLMFAVELIHGYFAIPGNDFRDRNLIPMQQANRNVLPSGYTLDELRAITGYLTTVKEEEQPDPLAGRTLPRPQEEINLALFDAAAAVKEAGNTVMKKAKGVIKRGKQEASVPGMTNTSTNATSSTDENSHSM